MENKTYQVITDRLVNMLETGTVPWRKPWAGADSGPKNLVSKREYTGINLWMLHSASFGSPYWVTFKQAKELGGTVRKGEKGTPVIFAKELPPKIVDVPMDNGGSEPMVDGKKLGGRMLKHYTAFNIEQCDGLEAPSLSTRYEHDPIASAEAIRAGYQGPTITHGGGCACYIPALDLVKMPEAERFERREEYYGTLFHELAHSTGHKSRLARITETANFGSQNYGKEELVAEMAAAYLCAQAGIEQATLENSAAYLRGWIDAIRGDNRLAISAASAATKAANLILNK